LTNDVYFQIGLVTPARARREERDPDRRVRVRRHEEGLIPTSAAAIEAAPDCGSDRFP
jgi:hypothetical protein